MNTQPLTRKQKADLHQQHMRAVSRNKKRSSEDRSIPPLAKEQIRRGRARQKIGMWGNISTDYRTVSTHDSKWDQTVQNRNV